MTDENSDVEKVHLDSEVIKVVWKFCYFGDIIKARMENLCDCKS